MPDSCKKCKFEEEDGGGSCEHCHRSFNNVSQFVMHISRSKACKDNFDPELLEDYKKISRKISKRKWYCNMAHNPNNAKIFKEERKERMKNKEKKPYYVPNEIKNSVSGRALEKVFRTVYDKFMNEAKLKIEQQSHSKDSLNKEAIDQALDSSFDEKYLTDQLTWCNHSDEALVIKGNESEMLEALFKRMDKHFKENFERLCIKVKEDWRDKKYYDVSFNFYHYALNRALLDCYGKSFKDLFENAIGNALDVVFLTLITTEDYFNDDKDLEKQLESAYDMVLSEQVWKLFDENTKEKKAMESMMEKALKKRFENNDLKY